MADAEELGDEVKRFIVQSLAAYDSPSTVATAVKEEFGLVVTRQRVHAYDPTKKAGESLGAELKAIFAATRKAFLEDTADIGIANKMVRLRMLERIASKAQGQGAHLIVLQALEAAAKEMGGAFTNKQQHELSGKIDTPPAAIINLTIGAQPQPASEAGDGVPDPRN